MRTRCLILLFCVLIPGEVFSIEWPAYHRATITTDYDSNNDSDARLQAGNLLTNNKINCVSDWTIRFIEDDGFFEIWPDLNPMNKQVGHNFMPLPFSHSNRILELQCEEFVSPYSEPRIFAYDIPKEGDLFYIHITANGYEYGDITGTYCDPRPGVVWEHSYHSGTDIGNVSMKADPIKEECHVYPVRDGTIVSVDEDQYHGVSITVQVSPDTYDLYSHLSDDRFKATSGSLSLPVKSSGPDATLLSAFVYHPYPHLHYGVLDSDFSLNSRSIKNPLNNHLSFSESSLIPPAIVDDPADQGILFRGDDAGIPTPLPLPSPYQSTEIKGSVDIEARMADNNGDPSRIAGINQIEYYLYSGIGIEIHFRESHVFLDQNTFCGESGQPEYSPYYFTEYGHSQVDYTTIYGKGNDAAYKQHEFFYVITNNTNQSGGKGTISTNGCWDTESEIITPAGGTDEFPDGPYTVLVRGADIQGNWSDDTDPVNSRTITVLNNYSHVLYVDDDSKLSCDLDDPFSSISEAMNYSSRDTLVYVAPGTYDSPIECFPIDIPEGVTVMGSGHEYSFIVGNSSTSVFRCTHPDAVLSGFTISGGGDDENQATVVIDNTSVKVRNCRISGNSTTGTGLLFFWSELGASVENCIIENHMVQGVWCDHSNYADIINCIIDNNNFIGIYGGSSAWVDMANCILQGHTYALAAEYNSHMTAHYSAFHSNTYDYYIAPGSSIDFYSCGQANPMFVTAHGRNYYLDYTSPCVNYGVDMFIEDPQIYLKTTRVDNLCDPGTGLYDIDSVDLGFHYDPIISTPTPYPTVPSTNTPLPTDTPTPTSTPVPGLGVVYLDSQEYFTEGDTAEILLCDADLNTDPMVAESYEVDVTSDTIFPTTIPMTVTEISIDSE